MLENVDLQSKWKKQTSALYIQGEQGEQWKSQKWVEVNAIGNAQSTTHFIDMSIYLSVYSIWTSEST